MHQTLSSGSKLSSCSSTCCGPDVCDIRTSYVSRQCTSSDGDNAAPCLPRGLAVLDLLDAELKTLIATYDIPLNLRPRLPDSNFRMINLPAGDTAIGVYSRIFDSSGVRIPFSSFLLAVLKYFKVHISQLVPLGLAKVITFEVLCRSLDIEPTVTLFRVFQTLSKQGDWFSFAKRGGSAPKSTSRLVHLAPISPEIVEACVDDDDTGDDDDFDDNFYDCAVLRRTREIDFDISKNG
ncbi:hypothetical protein Tco_1125258 [Tanacetum coccineum]|uniref:Transposase (putative) gypsy type domain-containing protein n=1 Tax=Tanacetum coccineum TaxID=301880 RepID=A0ABQ5J8L5_9ASTR